MIVLAASHRSMDYVFHSGIDSRYNEGTQECVTYLLFDALEAHRNNTRYQSLWCGSQLSTASSTVCLIG